MPYEIQGCIVLKSWRASAVRDFSCVGRQGADLLAEGQIGIAACVGRQHRHIARQCGGDREFLHRPINIGEAVTRRRLHQAAQPDTRAEDEFRIARLVAACTRSERRQDRAVTPVSPDREIVQAQLRHRATQLAQWRDDRPRLGRLAKRVIAEVEPAAFESRPRDAEPDQQLQIGQP